LASGPINPPSGAALYALQVLDETSGGAADARRVAGALASTQRVPRHGALGCGRLGYLHTHLHLQNANTAQGRRSTERLAARHGCTRSPWGGGVTAMARMGAAGRRPRPSPPATAHPRHEGRVHSSSRHGAKRARLNSGLAVRRALGAAHDGAAPDGATRGDSPAHLQKRQEPHRNGDSTGASRLGVATTPGCR
jgi:hypothetical protein